MSRLRVRVRVELLEDNQVVREVAEYADVQEGQGKVDLVAIAATATAQVKRQEPGPVAQSTRAPGGDASTSMSNSSLRMATASSDVRPERAASFADGAWLRLLEELMAEDELHETLRGLEPMTILTHADVRREVQAMDIVGVVNPLRYVLVHGPQRCKQVRLWVEKIRQSQSVQNRAALIVTVLERGEPRGPLGRRQRA